MGLFDAIGNVVAAPITGALNIAGQSVGARRQYKYWLKQMENMREWNEYDEKLNKMVEAGLNPLYAEGSPDKGNVMPVGSESNAFPMPNLSGIADLSDLTALQRAKQEIKTSQAEEEERRANASKSRTEEGVLREVTPYNIDLAIAQTDEHKANKDFVVRQTAAISEGLNIQREQVNQKGEELRQKWEEISLAWYNAQWQRDVGERGANAQETQAYAAELQSRFYKFNIEESVKKIQAETKQIEEQTRQLSQRFKSELRKNAAEILNKMAEADVKSLPVFVVRKLIPGGNSSFGAKKGFIDQYGAEMIGIYNDLVDFANDENTPTELKLKASKQAFRIGQSIQDTTISPSQALPRYKGKIEKGFNMPMAVDMDYSSPNDSY